MRADHATRHNAAVGALIGLAVGDALAALDEAPPRISGGPLASLQWGPVAARSFVAAEGLLNGSLLDMASSATDVVAASVALAAPDASPPLLADPDAVLMCSLVRTGLAGELDPGKIDAPPGRLGRAVDAVAGSRGFCEAVAAVELSERPVTAALAGLVWGPANIPAAWVTGVHGDVGARRYGLRQLRRLGERLLKQAAPTPPEPRRPLGPREVAPKLWLSNLHAVPRFIADHPDGAVISLCPTTGAFDTHPVRREFTLHDAAGSHVNPHLSTTIDEVLATIDAFHHDGRDVLVHCHHGASRTGLVLRAWLVEQLGLDVESATIEAQVLWSKTSTWNRAFSAEIERRAQVNRRD